jgi:uncharacterized membrane protein
VNDSTRAIWLALMMVFSFVIGGAAGLLSWAGGDDPAHAVVTGGASFGGTVLVLLALFYFATNGSKVDS